MKYPLDEKGVGELLIELALQDNAQNKEKEMLYRLLEEALPDLEDDSITRDIKDVLAAKNQRKMQFETHRFNQKNGHNVQARSPYAPQPSEIGKPIDVVDEGKLNAIENESGEMSEDEIAAMFQEVPLPKKKKQKKIEKMSLAEIEEWERQQDNSNDIYKVQARVKNAASKAVKANLTPQGVMVVNTFVHMLKLFYDFAVTVDDKDTRIKLTNLIKSQEDMPANLISALNAGVRSE